MRTHSPPTRRANSCVTAALDGSTLVLSPSLDYIELDAVGSVIWDAVSEPADLDQIVATLRQQYDVDDLTARRDVMRYLVQLRNLGLVVHDGDA